MVLERHGTLPIPGVLRVCLRFNYLQRPELGGAFPFLKHQLWVSSSGSSGSSFPSAELRHWSHQLSFTLPLFYIYPLPSCL